MIFSDIKAAIRLWVISVVPLETIFSNQNGNIPPNPFCTLLVMPISFLGHDEYSIDVNGDLLIKGHREIGLSVQYFGVNAIQNTLNLAESLEGNRSRELLLTDQIVFVNRTSGINDLSELLDTDIDERAGVDLLFRVPSFRIEAADVIDSVETEGELIKADGSTINSIFQIP